MSQCLVVLSSCEVESVGLNRGNFREGAAGMDVFCRADRICPAACYTDVLRYLRFAALFSGLDQ